MTAATHLTTFRHMYYVADCISVTRICPNHLIRIRVINPTHLACRHSVGSPRTWKHQQTETKEKQTNKKHKAKPTGWTDQRNGLKTTAPRGTRQRSELAMAPITRVATRSACNLRSGCYLLTSMN